ncbi:HNH endonuclease signature motif containing protein [Mycobacterium sp. Root265]|uniref:HNH endonuclease signature motif containing protein n=1 Tax=Mycobacterium sp. Root265 TaxID=1736504 RepID=UPI001F24C054|nr:HNH endonuclease signature motif containing protein [Mycobacterium sp. Root265]
MLDSPRRIVDEQPLLAVLAAAVTARNLLDHVIAQAVAAAERLGIPARKHLRSGADLLTSCGVAPGAAYRAARVGRAAHTLPALTRAQRLGGIGIEFADAVGKGVAHINSRVPLSEEDLNEMTAVVTDEGRVSANLDLDALTGEELLTALDPLCRPIPLPDGSPDPRPIGKRRSDALGQLVRTYLSHSRRPASGGVLPHVTLIRPQAPGLVDTLGFTGPVSAITADLIACDSTLTAVTVDPAGAPLNVGRSERLFTPAIRKGLAVRDGGCAHPGCGRPVSWCDAHHIRPWSAGGITSVDNGVLLCRLHHTAIHHGGWQVYLGADRHPWFIPPHDADEAEPAHLRSHARRTMTDLPTAA